jgi:hypothetical protein
MSLKDAFENPEQIRQRRLEARRALWNRIKAEAPDCAEFIELMTARYGKPEQVLVTLSSGEVLDSNNHDKMAGWSVEDALTKPVKPTHPRSQP